MPPPPPPPSDPLRPSPGRGVAVEDRVQGVHKETGDSGKRIQVNMFHEGVFLLKHDIVRVRVNAVKRVK